MKIGSLFTGYGGLDMAVETFFHATTAWTSDIDPGASQIITHRYPDAPNLGDITRINWAAVEPIDILCAGWPCQPFSLAGKRKGALDERALWPEVTRAVRILRPRFVVLENVAAIATAGELARAVGDLSALGYDAQWTCLRAADVGAPHGRARIFIVASDPGRVGIQRWAERRGVAGEEGPGTGEGLQRQRRRDTAGDGGKAAADANGERRERGRAARDRRNGPENRSLVAQHSDRIGLERSESQPVGFGIISERGDTGGELAADASGDGWGEGRPEPARLVGGSDAAQRSTGTATDTEGNTWRVSDRNYGVTANAPNWRQPQQPHRLDGGEFGTPWEDGEGLSERAGSRAGTGDSTRRDPTGIAASDPDRSGLGTLVADIRTGQSDIAWGSYEPAIRRWESILRRLAPPPTETSPKGSQRLSPRFVEWMMGLPEGWVTDVPGLNRNAQLKALGNGVVPQQALAALEVMREAA